MSDFLLRDWAPTGRVNEWIRDDSHLLEFDVLDGHRFVTCTAPDGRERGRAELTTRERDGAAILVPVSKDPDVVADALAFWTRHPSIHLAALGLSDRVIWPKEKP